MVEQTIWRVAQYLIKAFEKRRLQGNAFNRRQLKWNLNDLLQVSLTWQPALLLDGLRCNVTIKSQQVNHVREVR
ncbi:MAG: hypothetical protein ABT03_06715 [Comamonas sp. SCN 67-35]|nr:MAG: hypothetical protein ABT03_06715 [Comamonas sp. SCN 67-35]